MQQYPARQSESLLYKCNYGGRVSARQCKVTRIYPYVFPILIYHISYEQHPLC